MKKLLSSSSLSALALCLVLASAHATEREQNHQTHKIAKQSEADDLELWGKHVQHLADENKIVKILSKDLGGCHSIDTVVGDLGDTIAVIKKGERCKKEAFIYNFAESLGLKDCIAPSIAHKSDEGDVLFERFIRIEENYKIETASKSLQGCLINHMDERGALTVMRAKQRLTPEEMNILTSHISRNSVEKLLILHILTGANDDLSPNTLVRLGENGLLDLVLIDTERSFDWEVYPTCTALMLPQANYVLSPKMVDFIHKLDLSALDTEYGKQIESLFGGIKARINFIERVKHLKSASSMYANLSLRDILKYSFLFCPEEGESASLGLALVNKLVFGGFGTIVENEEEIIFVDQSYLDTTPSQKIDKFVPINLLNKLIAIKDAYGKYMSDQEKTFFSLPSGYLEFFRNQSTANHLESVLERLDNLKLSDMVSDMERKKKKEDEQKQLDEPIIESMWNLFEAQNTGKTYEKGKDKNTLLHLAARDGNEDLVQLLIEKTSQLVNISPSMWRNDERDTPLHIAVKGGHLNIAKLLLDKVPALKKVLRGSFDITLLHSAASSGRIDLIELLIKEIPALGSPNLKDEDGLTAFDYAKNEETKECLKKHGITQ